MRLDRMMGTAFMVASVPLLIGGPWTVLAGDVGNGLLLSWTGIMVAVHGALGRHRGRSST